MGDGSKIKFGMMCGVEISHLKGPFPAQCHIAWVKNVLVSFGKWSLEWHKAENWTFSILFMPSCMPLVSI